MIPIFLTLSYRVLDGTPYLRDACNADIPETVRKNISIKNPPFSQKLDLTKNMTINKLRIANRNKLKKKDTEKKKVVQISYNFWRREIYQETKEVRSEIEKKKVGGKKCSF